MLSQIINVLFPSKCIFCGTLLGISKELDICETCFKKLPFFDADAVETGGILHINGWIDGAICLFEYTGIVRESIARYKYRNKPGYYRTFAKMLSHKVQKVTNYCNFDIIISVPLHKNRERTRGYNQSYLISRFLSKELKIPEKSRLLVRTRDTGSQSLLGRQQRHANIKDAFAVYKPGKVKGKKILIVDDILTTGNTLNECSRVLKEAGAKSVTAAVIASGRKDWACF